MIVVSDTSPVLNLARIGRLELLPLLYKQVLVPTAVFEELTESKRDLPPAIDLASEQWLKSRAQKSGPVCKNFASIWTLAKLSQSCLPSNSELTSCLWMSGAMRRELGSDAG